MKASEPASPVSPGLPAIGGHGQSRSLFLRDRSSCQDLAPKVTAKAQRGLWRRCAESAQLTGAALNPEERGSETAPSCHSRKTLLAAFSEGVVNETGAPLRAPRDASPPLRAASLHTCRPRRPRRPLGPAPDPRRPLRVSDPPTSVPDNLKGRGTKDGPLDPTGSVSPAPGRTAPRELPAPFTRSSGKMGANPAEMGRTLGPPRPAASGPRRAGGRTGLQPQALAAALPGSSPGNGRPPAHPLAPGRGQRGRPGYLRSQRPAHSPSATGSSWTSSLTSLRHHARRKHSAARPATASWSGAAGGRLPSPTPSRSRAGSRPSPGGSRRSCFPGPGGRAEEPRGRRWRGRAGGSGPRALASPRRRAPRGPGAPRRLLRPSLRGFQRRGLHTAPPADPEEKAEEDVQEVGRETGRRGLRAPTMDGTVEAAPAPSCSSRSGSLSASASACWPPALPPLPAPPSLTDPRWLPTASSAASGGRK